MSKDILFDLTELQKANVSAFDARDTSFTRWARLFTHIHCYASETPCQMVSTILYASYIHSHSLANFMRSLKLSKDVLLELT